GASLYRYYFNTPIVLELLIRYHGPAGLQAAGKSAMKHWAKNHRVKILPCCLITSWKLWLSKPSLCQGTHRGTHDPAGGRPDPRGQRPTRPDSYRSRDDARYPPCYKGYNLTAWLRTHYIYTHSLHCILS